MKILIVEDDFITRKILNNLLKKYGEVDVVVDGLEALDAFNIAFEENERYDVMFLDVKMPKLDGQEVLKKIREFEGQHNIHGKDGIKIIMTTILKDSDNIIKAFREQCEGYIIKPVDKEKLERALSKLELI